MIYSAVSLLFSLTVNGFDLGEISRGPLILTINLTSLGHCPSLYLTPSLENGAKNENM